MEDDGRTDPAVDLAGEVTEVAHKRARRGRDGGDLKRVAEIVMVLSAMGEMRGGRDPTPAERAMVAEARERLAWMCEEVKPKDLFSKEAIRVVAEDLGVNRSRDPVLGFRPPKMSIADKLLLTKKKMEESKEFATLYSPQPLPVGFGANSESHGTMLHGTPRFLPDRPNPMALPSGVFQSASPVDHAPKLASATKSSQVNETQPASTLIKPYTNPLEKDSPLLALPHSEVPHFRSDARSPEPAYLTQLRATASSADYVPTKTPTNSVQSVSAATVMLGQANNLLDHTPVKSEGAHEGNTIQSSYQLIGSQETHTSGIPATPGNVLIGHQPSQSLTYVHATSYFTNHNDIAKAVQIVLQQKISDHPNWAPPSIEYMNKPLNCQICKITINDVESLLVCDACEKATHLKCLQSYGNKGIPKAEWHCPKCLITSNGKPLPPKYGRVTRSIAASKASSNTVGTYASSEKRAENPDSNVNQQKIISNRNSSLPYLVQPSNMVITQSESALESKEKATSASKMQGSDFLDPGMKREDEIHTGSSSYQSKESENRDGMVCVARGTQSESSDRQSQNSDLSPYEPQRSASESLLESKIVAEQSCSDYQNGLSEISHQFQPLSQSQACKGMEVPISAEVSANQLHEISESSTDELKSCHLKETPEYEGDCNINPQDLQNSQATLNGPSDSSDATINCGRPLMLDSHTVDWVGDILEAVDEKNYYRSCRINGVLYNLQDHVIISCKGWNIHPSKLQSFWEDKNNGSKWATVDQYFFPSDLEVVNPPSTPDNNEVYASNNRRTIIACSIHGPCEVLRIDQFKEEVERSLSGDATSLHPIFMCKWLYDESKNIFRSITN